jgi:hypothetical protein
MGGRYAKLVTELHDATPATASSTIRNIRSLIGRFNLDPNR